MVRIDPLSVWDGYRPTPHGYEQSYHLRKHPKTGKWTVSMRLNGDTYFAIPEVSKGVEQVVFNAKLLAKEFGQVPGGVITVNEFKQVVKPLYIDRHPDIIPIYLGTFPDLHLVFGDDQHLMDNSNDEGLNVGDAWPYQKIGIRYFYRPRMNDFYMIHGDFFNRTEIAFNGELGVNCEYLISTVNIAKNGSGGVFYVNEHGLVYAPCWDPEESADDGAWCAVYAGRIDYDRWITSDQVCQPLNHR